MTPTTPEQAGSTLQAQGSFIAQADRGGTAMVNIGIASSELPSIISAATKSWEELTDKQQQDLDRIRAQLDVSAGALQRLLQDIGEADVPAKGQAAKLAEIAHRYKDLQAQIAAAPEHDPAVAYLRGQAKEALASGDLDRADALLGEVQKAQGDLAGARAVYERVLAIFCSRVGEQHPHPGIVR